MSSISFCKFHGFGNDYIVVEKEQLSIDCDIEKLTVEMCHRNTGVGGDGIALLEKLDGAEADYSCRIINPDGSEAGFSGNGTRCAVSYLYYKNLWSDKNLKLKTKSGIKNYKLIEEDETVFWFLAELGKPTFASAEIPFLMDKDSESVVGEMLELSDRKLPITALNVGNPVCVVFVKDFEFDWRSVGKEIESHERFPERSNVVFVRAFERQNIEIRIWERGAGETSSSGTCSIAAAVASAFTDQADREVSVHAVGGTTEALWRNDDEMLIAGRADLAFSGEWFPPVK